MPNSWYPFFETPQPPTQGGILRWSDPSSVAHIIASWKPEERLWIEVPSESEARDLLRNLSQTISSECIYYLPSISNFVGGETSPPASLMRDRAQAFIGLLEQRVQILVTTPMMKLEYIPTEEWFRKYSLTLEVEQTAPRSFLLNQIQELGFARQSSVGGQGEYAVRGNIIDLWPYQWFTPLRIEFNGDEIEEIVAFDLDTQRRITRSIPKITLYPRFEGQRSPETLQAALAQCLSLSSDGKEDYEYRKSKLASYGDFNGEELFYPLMGHPLVTIEAWTQSFRRLHLEYDWFTSITTGYKEEIEASIRRLRDGGVLSPSFNDWFAPYHKQKAWIELTEWKTRTTLKWNLESPPSFEGSIPLFLEGMKKQIEDGRRIILSGSTQGVVDRLQSIIETSDIKIPGDGVSISCVLKDWTQGFISVDHHFCLITESEIFGKRLQRRTVSKSKSSRFLSDLSDLKSGDYVVHLDHGIGRFIGFTEIEAGGEKHEVVRLQYAEGAFLDVSLDRADLIQRYVSTEGASPSVDKLGGGNWVKVKRRARKSIKDLSDELIKLYAKRQKQPGHAYPEDGPEMAEFELSFPYEPTADQLEASSAIKRDLESPRPMDRLLVGDVGFGKTEVAMRAAAKVVFAGKQVAILCPTTVLCFQHFQTFQERFKAFPLRIEMLNRFVERSKVEGIKEGIESGTVDIVVGTHQLLGGKIHFSDLGLVVVDEEQRFGVAHKEKMKQLKSEIDQLAMSATPIPRTLHMSLTGLREISLIETPPQNRMAIETEVALWSDELIQSAIRFELKRKGQVFFVHNRVESIESIASRIQDLVPEARIGIGHGQLPDHELENIMLSFMEGSTDVLVSTTIIENGLDIPNANTLIVHRADMFGLSQLYQLRGRVGRSDVPAFAYLLVPERGQLTDEARQRLQALEDFSDLGSGFRIAALDLEIRGAGNVLGGQQSGHIGAIGFELYMQLLEEALQQAEGTPFWATECKMDLMQKPQISSSWIEGSADRLGAYKRISRMKNEKEIQSIKQDLEDRYGAIPEHDASSNSFFMSIAIKLQAQALGIIEITGRDRRLRFKISPQSSLNVESLIAWGGHNPDLQYLNDGSFVVPIKEGSEAYLQEVQRILGELSALK